MQDLRTSHEAESTGPGLLMALANLESDAYDDGYLRIEHQNYYVTCGDRPLKLGRAPVDNGRDWTS